MGATDYPCRGERHGVGKGGERRRERRGRSGSGVTRTGTAKGDLGANGEGSGVQGEKRSPLVGDVSAYWAAYEGDVSD